MASVLITAFEPYDCWTSNASWLALVQLTKDLPAEPTITTRLYPVDFAAVKEKLANDLRANYDYALHLGQAPGSTHVQLEAFAINIGGSSRQSPDEFRALVDGGPAAYRSTLPLASWSAALHEAGIPAQVSYHAGAYLCNATLYFSSYLAERMGLRTQSTFVHLPLDVTQTARQAPDMASLPSATCAKSLRIVLEDLARGV